MSNKGLNIVDATNNCSHITKDHFKKEQSTADVMKEMLFENFPASIRPKDELLIDLGCGTGDSLYRLIENSKFKKIIAVDGSEKMISFVKDNFQEKDIKLETQVVDLRKGSINVLSNSADLVISCFVISYLNNLEKIFSEVSRILKRGSFFAFDVVVHNESYSDTLLIKEDCSDVEFFVYHRSKISYLANLNGLEIFFICNFDLVKFKSFPKSTCYPILFLRKK